MTDVADLCSLHTQQTGQIASKAISSETVALTLASRFKLGLCYTRLSDSGIVVINPNKPLQDLGDASADDYASEAFGNGKTLQRLPPHLYDFACRVYSVMKGTGRTQTIVYK